MRTLRVWTLAAAALILGLPAASANPIVGFIAHLHAADEVPAVLSSGGGTFHGQLALVTNVLGYKLHYFGLAGQVTEIDLQLAQPGANGGRLVVLCSNLPIASPAAVQPCPAAPGTISGQLRPVDAVGDAAVQGAAAGDLGAVEEAMNAGLVYVNIRTDHFTAGEVRGQLSPFIISPD
jgi:CHRD domain